MDNADTNVVALSSLLDSRRVWRGQSPHVDDASIQPTGHAALDAQLPLGGWPDAALTEILSARPGLGELCLVWPTLARLTAAGERVVLIAPPYLIYPHAWLQAGVDLGRLSVIQVQGKDVLWAAEQCLCSGSCGAVLCWPNRADDRALRRLQVAAGRCRSLQRPGRPLPLRSATSGKPSMPHLQHCAWCSRVRLSSCGCSSAAAAIHRRPRWRIGSGIEGRPP